MSSNWISKIQELNSKRISFVIATIVQINGSSPRDTGSKMIIENGNNNHIHGTIGGGGLEKRVIEDSVNLFNAGSSLLKNYPLDERAGQACGGTADVFLELVDTKADLYIFGAGHVGQMLCRVLEGSPFTIHLIDERDEWVNSEKVPSTVHRYPMMWNDAISNINWSKEKTYVVVMTYDHTHDFDIVKAILKNDMAYIGAIGSKTKWAKLKKELKELKFSDDEIDRVHSPIGIKIGGKTPSEVAISVGAELIQKYHSINL